MKILHVIPSVGPQRGGPSFTIKAMTRALAGAGLNVHVATTDDDGRQHLVVDLEQPLAQDGGTYWYFRRQTRFYTVSWPLTRWLSRHIQSYDLVHIHALFSYAALPASWYAARRKVPYIIRPLGTLNRYGMYRRRPWLKQLSFTLLERHMLRHAAVIHYTSAQERSEALELGITRPAVIIPNPIDLPAADCKHRRGHFRRQYPQLADRLVILFMSRLDPKKGLDLLLPAFARLRAQQLPVALVIAGTGEPAFVAGLQACAANLGITAEIVWAGFLEGAAKQSALTDADLFVLPSYSENFGNVVVEAMHCAVPVVISDQVGIHQEVADSGAGVVIGCTVDELVAAMAQLCSQPALRGTMGAQGSALVSSRFSPPAITGRLLDLYADVLYSQRQGAIV